MKYQRLPTVSGVQTLTVPANSIYLCMPQLHVIFIVFL